MPSITMKPGLDQRRIHPHHDAAVTIHGCTLDENALKQTRRRKECTGTCRTGSAEEPQRRVSVPWIRAWTKRSKESSRKAFVESVDRVRGRKIRI